MKIIEKVRRILDIRFDFACWLLEYESTTVSWLTAEPNGK